MRLVVHNHIRLQSSHLEVDGDPRLTECMNCPNVYLGRYLPCCTVLNHVNDLTIFIRTYLPYLGSNDTVSGSLLQCKVT